jgi:hypothetical protein
VDELQTIKFWTDRVTADAEVRKYVRMLDFWIFTLELTLSFPRSIDLRHVHERIGRGRSYTSRGPPLMDSGARRSEGLDDSRSTNIDFLQLLCTTIAGCRKTLKIRLLL